MTCYEVVQISDIIDHLLTFFLFHGKAVSYDDTLAQNYFVPKEDIFEF